MKKQEKGIKFQLKQIQRFMMTGISYMIPVVVIAGITMGVTSMIGEFAGFTASDEVLLESSDTFVNLVVWTNQVAGQNFMELMYPILAGYIAFGIADRPALAPGLLGGMLANLLNAGFFGALIIGFIAGYSIKWINKAIKIKRQYIGVKTMFLLPVLGSIVVIIASRIVVAPVGIGFTNLSTWFVETIGQSGGALLSGALGSARAFDFGGPVNKAAGTIGKQLYFDAGYTYIGLMLGSIVPPIGVGLATIMDKFIVGKSVFRPQLKGNGTPCFILGLLGISEGVLAFAIADPLTIPITMLGSGISAALGYMFGCSIFPGSSYGFYMYPLVENIGGFLIALIVGVIVVMLGMIFRNLQLQKKELANE